MQFHWNAAYEHLPLWQLSMRTWSGIFGQSETMLRLLPALAGAASVPLAWYWLRLLWPQWTALRLISAALIAFSPTLILYAQEARMYTVVVLLSLLSLILLVDLLLRPGWVSALLFALINCLMVGFHYYSLMLIACRGAVCGRSLASAVAHTDTHTVASGGVVAQRIRRLGRANCALDGVFAWLSSHLAGRAGRDQRQSTRLGTGRLPPFLDTLWRDLTFGAFRWQPEFVQSASLLLPLMAIGAVALLFASTGKAPEAPILRSMGLACGSGSLAPADGERALFRTLAARYVLFIMPALYTLAQPWRCCGWTAGRAPGHPGAGTGVCAHGDGDDLLLRRLSEK